MDKELRPMSGWYALAIVAAIWGESDFLLWMYLRFKDIGDEAAKVCKRAKTYSAIWQLVAIFGLLMGAKIL